MGDLREPGTGAWRVARSTGGKFDNQAWGQWSPNIPWQHECVGDFDGDGRSDILWRNSVSGQNVIWKSGSNATTRAECSCFGSEHVLPPRLAFSWTTEPMAGFAGTPVSIVAA